MRSLRLHLMRLVCAASIPLAAAVGLGLFLFMRSALLARFDDTLLARARALAGMVKVEDNRLELDFGDEPQYDRPGIGTAFEMWVLDGDSPGAVVARSPSIGSADLPLRVPRDEVLTWDAPMPGAGAARFTALTFMPRPDPEAEPLVGESPDPRVGRPLLLITGQARAEVDRTLGQFAGAIAAGGIILIAASLIAVRAALTRGLRPVEDLAGAVASIGPADLARRLPTDSTPPELRPFAVRTNELLERLDTAFQREKRLAATAAHELRTPIAELRTVAELALSRERDAAALRRALAEIVEVASRMGDSTDAVLRLARIQAGRERPTIAPMNLRAELAPAWDRLIAPLSSRGVGSHLDVPPDLTIRADAPMFRVIIENLLTNAAELTPGGGVVRARATGNGQGAELTITNAIGPDRDAAPGVMHAGLGLQVARAMAEACAGTLSAERHDSTFVVRLGFS